MKTTLLSGFPNIYNNTYTFDAHNVIVKECISLFSKKMTKNSLRSLHSRMVMKFDRRRLWKSF